MTTPTFEIWTTGGIDYLSKIYQGYGLIFGDSFYQTSLRMFLTYGIIYASVMVILKKNLQVFFAPVLGSFLLFLLFFGMKVNVNIVDTTMFGSPHRVYKVSHVPVGVAMINSLFSGLSIRMTSLVSSIFHYGTVSVYSPFSASGKNAWQSANLDYPSTGYGGFLDYIAVAKNVDFQQMQTSQTSEFAPLLNEYIKQCVVPWMAYMPSDKVKQKFLNNTNLIDSIDMEGNLFFSYQGLTTTCKDAYLGNSGNENFDPANVIISDIADDPRDEEGMQCGTKATAFATACILRNGIKHTATALKATFDGSDPKNANNITAVGITPLQVGALFDSWTLALGTAGENSAPNMVNSDSGPLTEGSASESASGNVLDRITASVSENLTGGATQLSDMIFQAGMVNAVYTAAREKIAGGTIKPSEMAMAFEAGRRAEEAKVMGKSMGLYAKKVIPYMRLGLECVVLILIPVMVLLMFLPGYLKVIRGFIMTMAGIYLCDPAFAAVNGIVNISTLASLNARLQAAGAGGISMTSMRVLNDTIDMMPAVAGYLAISVPSIAFMLLKGGEIAMHGLMGMVASPMMGSPVAAGAAHSAAVTDVARQTGKSYGEVQTAQLSRPWELARGMGEREAYDKYGAKTYRDTSATLSAAGFGSAAGYGPHGMDNAFKVSKRDMQAKVAREKTLSNLNISGQQEGTTQGVKTASDINSLTKGINRAGNQKNWLEAQEKVETFDRENKTGLIEGMQRRANFWGIPINEMVNRDQTGFVIQNDDEAKRIAGAVGSPSMWEKFKGMNVNKLSLDGNNKVAFAEMSKSGTGLRSEFDGRYLKESGTIGRAIFEKTYDSQGVLVSSTGKGTFDSPLTVGGETFKTGSFEYAGGIWTIKGQDMEGANATMVGYATGITGNNVDNFALMAGESKKGLTSALTLSSNEMEPIINSLSVNPAYKHTVNGLRALQKNGSATFQITKDTGGHIASIKAMSGGDSETLDKSTHEKGWKNITTALTTVQTGFRKESGTKDIIWNEKGEMFLRGFQIASSSGLYSLLKADTNLMNGIWGKGITPQQSEAAITQRAGQIAKDSDNYVTVSNSTIHQKTLEFFSSAGLSTEKIPFVKAEIGVKGADSDSWKNESKANVIAYGEKAVIIAAGNKWDANPQAAAKEFGAKTKEEYAIKHAREMMIRYLHSGEKKAQ